MEESGCSQEKLAEICTMRGAKATQSKISKLLSDSSESIPLFIVTVMCDYLEIDMKEILSCLMEQDNKSEVAAEYDNDYIYSSDTLISDPSHTAFRGYRDINLDVYFYPTISYQSELLKGTLSFESDTENKICKVTMIIDAEANKKIYTGIFRISLQQNACYIVVSSKELGEISTIFFRHRFFSNSPLKIRLACCNTISAGDARRPCMHRMVIMEADKLLTDEDKSLIKSQLLMNDSQIRISETNMQILLNSGNEIYNSIFKKERSKGEGVKVFHFEETDILNLNDYTLAQKSDAISKMRLASFSPQRYNKSSAKSDDLLYKNLFTK